jgi:multidrug resistance efflux pump
VACPIVKNLVENRFGIRVTTYVSPAVIWYQMRSHAISTRQAYYFAVLLRVASKACGGNGSMNTDVADCVESDEIIFNIDVPDDTLERAAGSVDGRAITWIYCTQVWYNCGWPQ